MNKPNRMSLGEYHRTLLKSADYVRAKRRKPGSERSLFMYHLGMEIALLIAVANMDRIDVNKPDPLTGVNK